MFFCAPTYVFAAPASVIHIYEFNSSYTDSLGGPAIVATGPSGSLTATEYVFGTADGLSLSNGVNSAEYSIEMLFHIDVADNGYVKFIDFKNLTSDNGLYNYNTDLYFYNEVEGPPGVINNGTTVHVVLTRDAATKEVVGYVNGAQQITFTDSSDLAVFNATNNIINFFADDTTTSGREDSSGAVDRIRIYSGVLTPPQVTNLYNGGEPPAPTPASIPTMTQWGMIILTLLIGFAAIISIRKQKLAI
jgi:hypothetical protein